LRRAEIHVDPNLWKYQDTRIGKVFEAAEMDMTSAPNFFTLVEEHTAQDTTYTPDLCWASKYRRRVRSYIMLS